MDAIGCDMCGARAVSQCQRCNSAVYCSAACQADDWKLHHCSVCAPSATAAIGGVAIGVDMQDSTERLRSGLQLFTEFAALRNVDLSNTFATNNPEVVAAALWQTLPSAMQRTYFTIPHFITTSKKKVAKKMKTDADELAALGRTEFEGDSPIKKLWRYHDQKVRQAFAKPRDAAGYEESGEYIVEKERIKVAEEARIQQAKEMEDRRKEQKAKQEKDERMRRIRMEEEKIKTKEERREKLIEKIYGQRAKVFALTQDPLFMKFAFNMRMETLIKFKEPYEVKKRQDPFNGSITYDYQFELTRLIEEAVGREIFFSDADRFQRMEQHHGWHWRAMDGRTQLWIYMEPSERQECIDKNQEYVENYMKKVYSREEDKMWLYDL